MSKWPLSRASVVRVTNGMEKYYNRSPHDPGEHRLGGRVALFVEATVDTTQGEKKVTLVSFHATTSWANKQKHWKEVLGAIRKRIDEYGNSWVFVGGDTWEFTCDKLNMNSLVRERAGVNMVSDKPPYKPFLGPKWRDDYICVEREDKKTFKYNAPDIRPIAVTNLEGKL